MGQYSQEILSACKLIGCNCVPLEAQQALSLRSAVYKKFARPTCSKPLWERLVGASAVYTPNGWSYLATFTQDHPFLFFFDVPDDDTVLLLEVCPKVTEVLAECTGFVFYVTNPTHDYVICFNDHDVLIGVGTAAEWIESLKDNT